MTREQALQHMLYVAKWRDAIESGDSETARTAFFNAVDALTTTPAPAAESEAVGLLEELCKSLLGLPIGPQAFEIRARAFAFLSRLDREGKS